MAPALSTSLFAAFFGVSSPPAQFGLDRYGIVKVPDWMTSLKDIGRCGRMPAQNPGERLPLYGIANYGAIDHGLAEGAPILVTMVGLDRLDNWAGLTPQQEKDRRARWLDALQAALDCDYPGIGGAVTERLFLNAKSMQGFLNTPEGAVMALPPCRRSAASGRDSALAEDAGSRPFSRLLVCRLRRILRRHARRRRSGVARDGEVELG